MFERNAVVGRGADADRERRVRRLLEHVRNGSTDEFESIIEVDAAEFASPQIAELEREQVFGRVPTIVAHGSEIAEPGDFVTARMPRNQVLVVRQKDGSVKAFVNQCRHRGNMLEETPSGSCRLFSCGYHRWSYNTDGSLRAITRENTVGEVDHAKYGLVELPCQERHGFVWLIDRAGAHIDVEAHLGPDMDGILHSYGLDKLEVFKWEGYDEPVNWKIMQDAFVDGYHIQYAHPNTAGKVIHTNILAFDDFGGHARWLAPRKTIDRWIDEDPGDRSLSEYVTEACLLMPNHTLLRLPDNHFELLTFRPHPTEPDRCRMEMRVIVQPQENSPWAFDEWTTRWERNWTILLDVLHGEDFPLLRKVQQALLSGDAATMIYGRNEVGNQLFYRELHRLRSS